MYKCVISRLEGKEEIVFMGFFNGGGIDVDACYMGGLVAAVKTVGDAKSDDAATAADI